MTNKLSVKALRTALRAIDATATVSVADIGDARVLTIRCEDREAPAKAGIVADHVDTTGGRFVWRHVFQIVEEGPMIPDLRDLVAQLIANERTAPRTEALDDGAVALRARIDAEMARQRLRAALERG